MKIESYKLINKLHWLNGQEYPNLFDASETRLTKTIGFMSVDHKDWRQKINLDWFDARN